MIAQKIQKRAEMSHRVIFLEVIAYQKLRAARCVWRAFTEGRRGGRGGGGSGDTFVLNELNLFLMLVVNY